MDKKYLDEKQFVYSSEKCEKNQLMWILFDKWLLLCLTSLGIFFVKTNDKLMEIATKRLSKYQDISDLEDDEKSPYPY